VPEHPLATLLILAVMTEFITEVIKDTIPFSDRVPGSWIAAVMGVCLCYLTDTGLLALAGGYSRNLYADYFVTGLIISRGSGVIHELIDALKGFTRRLAAPP
jgi:hypothetical protein